MRLDLNRPTWKPYGMCLNLRREYRKRKVAWMILPLKVTNRKAWIQQMNYKLYRNRKGTFTHSMREWRPSSNGVSGHRLRKVINKRKVRKKGANKKRLLETIKWSGACFYYREVIIQNLKVLIQYIIVLSIVRCVILNCDVNYYFLVTILSIFSLPHVILCLMA